MEYSGNFWVSCFFWLPVGFYERTGIHHSNQTFNVIQLRHRSKETQTNRNTSRSDKCSESFVDHCCLNSSRTTTCIFFQSPSDWSPQPDCDRVSQLHCDRVTKSGRLSFKMDLRCHRSWTLVWNHGIITITPGFERYLVLVVVISTMELWTPSLSLFPIIWRDPMFLHIFKLFLYISYFRFLFNLIFFWHESHVIESSI